NSDATFAWPNVSCLPPGLNFDLRRDTAKTPVVPLEVVEVDVVVVPLVMGVGLLCVSGAPAAFSSAARAVACPGVSTSECCSAASDGSAVARLCGLPPDSPALCAAFESETTRKRHA